MHQSKGREPVILRSRRNIIFIHLTILDDLSAVALATSMINKTHKIVSIEGLSGFIELGMLQSVVGKSFRFVMASGFANWQLPSRNPLMTN
jgi:hypothetical protein